MKNLPAVSGKILISALRKYGFLVERQKGSHVRLKYKSANKTLKLTVPLHDPLKKGTLRHGTCVACSLPQFLKIEYGYTEAVQNHLETRWRICGALQAVKSGCSMRMGLKWTMGLLASRLAAPYR